MESQPRPNTRPLRLVIFGAALLVFGGVLGDKEELLISALGFVICLVGLYLPD